MLKRFKGVFLFLWFLGIAVVLYTNRETGTATFLSRYDFALESWVVLFVFSAVINLWVAIKKAKWQILGHLAWYSYTLATVLAYRHGDVPLIAAFIYSGVSVMLMLDTLNDEGLLDKWKMNRF